MLACHVSLSSIIETRAISTVGSKKKNKKKQAPEQTQDNQSSSSTNNNDTDSLNIDPTSSISHDESTALRVIVQPTAVLDSSNIPKQSSNEYVGNSPSMDVHSVQQPDDDDSEDEHPFNSALSTSTTSSILRVAMNPVLSGPPVVPIHVIDRHPVNKQREENTNNVEREEVASNGSSNQHHDVNSKSHEQPSGNDQTNESRRQSSRHRKRKRSYSPSDYR